MRSIVRPRQNEQQDSTVVVRLPAVDRSRAMNKLTAQGAPEGPSMDHGNSDRGHPDTSTISGCGDRCSFWCFRTPPATATTVVIPDTAFNIRMCSRRPEPLSHRPKPNNSSAFMIYCIILYYYQTRYMGSKSVGGFPPTVAHPGTWPQLKTNQGAKSRIPIVRVEKYPRQRAWKVC